ncbi:hypothetical protein [Streptomyces atroolivaceus]|nr:hypothetical protein [Streptomyces atroolivaceus]
MRDAVVTPEGDRVRWVELPGRPASGAPVSGGCALPGPRRQPESGHG